MDSRTIVAPSGPAMSRSVNLIGEIIDAGCNFVAGWAGGIAQIVVGHPFETVKVRLQTSTPAAAAAASTSSAPAAAAPLTASACLTRTFGHEGVHGFFKGMAFPIATVGAMNSVLFGVYGVSLRWIEWLRRHHHHGGAASPPPLASRRSYADVYLAGCVAGVAQLSVAVPSELVKVKLQVQTGTAEMHGPKWLTSHIPAALRKATPPRPPEVAAVGSGGAAAMGGGTSSGAIEFRGPVDCLRKMYRAGGVRGLYRGAVITAVRDVPASGLYVLIYEYLCDRWSRTTGAVLMAGGLAGVCSWSVVVPLDVVKSRLQAQNHRNRMYEGIVDCCVKSYRAEGGRVFFRGFWVIALRAFPTNAGIFLAYSHTLKHSRSVMDGYTQYQIADK